MKKNTSNYVDNEEFYQEIKKYLTRYNEAIKNNQEQPQMPDKLGRYFIKISENYSNHHWFRSYPFKDELIQEGIKACCIAVTKYNVEMTNPFAFFTRTIYFAFRNKIDDEKDYLYKKLKSLEKSIIFDEGYSGETDNMSEDLPYSSNGVDNMNHFIKDYEKSLQEKKIKRKEKLEEKKRLNAENSLDN